MMYTVLSCVISTQDFFLKFRFQFRILIMRDFTYSSNYVDVRTQTRSASLCSSSEMADYTHTHTLAKKNRPNLHHHHRTTVHANQTRKSDMFSRNTC